MDNQSTQRTVVKRRRYNNYAFIDSQNVNLSIQSEGWKLDFARFRRYLQEKYHVTKAYIFIGYMPENTELYINLQKQGYILIFKPTLPLPDEKVKGNVDAELVLYSMVEINNYDQAVIVSGDGDFYSLVDYLNKHNKLSRLLIPNVNKYSKLLRQFEGKVDFMNNLRYKLEYTHNKNERQLHTDQPV